MAYATAFNCSGWGLDDLEFITPHLTRWGYLKILRFHGHVEGFVKIHVRCTDGCTKWDVHNRVSLSASGNFEWGPNLIATAIGFRAGLVGSLGANAVIKAAGLFAHWSTRCWTLHDKRPAQ